jgi:hypothetical protein
MNDDDEDFVCDQHMRTHGYEPCCDCENDNPADQRVCAKAEDTDERGLNSRQQFLRDTGLWQLHQDEFDEYGELAPK